jgi:hypothetical protein
MAPNAISTARDDAPTTELVTGSVASHCGNCHAPLASDQRYCLNCGERRGKARFPVASTAPAATETVVAGPTSPRRPVRNAGATLVAGVATLLIALGVGVLIGHNANPAPRASAPVQVVTVPGAGGSSGTGAAATNHTTHAKTAKVTKSGKPAKTKTVVVHLTPKVTQAATSAASKVFGSSGRLSNNVTQTVGGSCSGGAGCQNGKFTGNAFAP